MKLCVCVWKVPATGPNSAAKEIANEIVRDAGQGSSPLDGMLVCCVCRLSLAVFCYTHVRWLVVVSVIDQTSEAFKLCTRGINELEP
jgi:hypothetical protein